MNIVLIHWNATEAAERAQQLTGQGHRVQSYSQQRGIGYRAFRQNPPDVFVIDLSRLPSQGRALGVYLRQQKALRHLPIVFAGGEPEKISPTRKLLPDATYSEWKEIAAALAKAVKNVLREPVVPRTMDGYSGTPLPRKLGIRAGSVVALLGAPREFPPKLNPLPEDVRILKQARNATVALLFVKSRAELERKFLAVAGAMADQAALWVVWPKQASGVKTDLSATLVRACGLGHAWVDYKVCAVDQTWSGLCFARRKGK
jgi:CheY-like chemotaxis protein